MEIAVALLAVFAFGFAAGWGGSVVRRRLLKPLLGPRRRRRVVREAVRTVLRRP